MQNHLYVISFTVGSESGLALVSAQDDKSAFQILKNGGSRNGAGYSLVQIRDIGMTCDCHYGLLMESFVNALVAYDAIMNAANKLVGPKGDKGDDGLAVDAVKYTSQSLTDGQKSQARDNIGATPPEIFWAIFDETPYLEVLDAHNSGKICVCKYDGHMYYLSGLYRNGDYYLIYFDELEGSFNADSVTLTVFVRSDDHWDCETGYFVVGENSATDWNDKYTKPLTGIPASDLANGVVPVISTDISSDATSDTKTVSPKAVKSYVDEHNDKFVIHITDDNMEGEWELDGTTAEDVNAAYDSGKRLLISANVAGGNDFESQVLSVSDDRGGFGLILYFINGDSGSIESITVEES